MSFHGSTLTGSTLTGATALLRLVLRRDRVRLVVWATVIVGLVAVSAASVIRLYDTSESLASYAELVRGNAALTVQAGPGYGLDEPTTGSVLMNEMSIWTIVAVALMSIFMVTRHTRAEEETGRAELLRAAPVGRHATAVAAVAGVLLANVVVGAGVALVLVVVGLGVAGALAFGAALVGAGMVFAGVALTAGQVASSARATNGAATAAVGAAFVLRAVGDVGDGRLSWLSPIGWAQAIRPYADERWWVLLLPLGATIGLVLAADALTSRRDLGGGLIPQRAGPPVASPGLGSSLGLAVRLHRAPVIGWCVGIAAIGFFYGVVAVEAEALLADNPEMADFFAQFGERSLTDAFLATSMLMLALIGSGATISAVLRLRGEEMAGRVDALLATPLPRQRWMLGHLAVASAGTVLVMVSGGLATGAGFATVTGEAEEMVRVTGAALVMIPAMLVLGGVTAALVGLLPRWSLVAWAGLALAAVVGLLGDVLDLPGWVRDLSPFGHVPSLPGGTFTLGPLIVLAGVAAALAAGGVAGIRHRDLG